MSKHRGKQQRFVLLHHWLLNTAAWKDLGAVERSIYVELLYRYNGQNNGRIGYSARTAAQSLKIGKATAARALRSLQAHGFIVVEKPGVFHCKIRHASEYRLTAHESDIATNYADKLCTKEFTRWPEVQITVSPARPTGLVATPIRARSETVSSSNSPDGVNHMLFRDRDCAMLYAGEKPTYVVVKNGRFTDGPFTDRGAPLPPGTYGLMVTSPYVAVGQSKSPGVLAIIGEYGENMRGPLVNGCCFQSFQDQAEIQKQKDNILKGVPTLGASIYYARYVEIAP